MKWVIEKMLEKKKKKKAYLAIGGSVFFDSPTSFGTESLQDLVVVAVLGQVEVSLSSEPCVYLRRYGPPPPLSPPVVLPLPPRRFSPSRRC